jgi:hypothetical protein
VTIMHNESDSGANDAVFRAVSAIEQIAAHLKQIEPAIARIAEHFDPQKRGVVGMVEVSPYFPGSIALIKDEAQPDAAEDRLVTRVPFL